MAVIFKSKSTFRSILVQVFGLLTSRAAEVQRYGLKVVARVALNNKGILITLFFLTLITTVFEGGTIALLTLAVSVLVESGPTSFGDHFGKLGQNLDEWAAEKDRGLLFLGITLVAVGSQLLRSVLLFLTKVVSIKTLTRINKQLLNIATTQVMRFNYSEVSKYSAGELNEKINSVGQMSNIIHHGQGALLALSMLVMYFFLMLVMSPLLTLITLGLVITLGLCMTWTVKQLKRIGRKLAETSIDTSTVTVEFLNAPRLLRIFAATRYAEEVIRSQRSAMLKASQKAQILKSTISPIVEIVTVISLAGFLIAGYLVFDGTTESIPKLFLFVLVLHRAMPQIQKLGQTAAFISGIIGRLDVVGKLMRCDDKGFIRSGGSTISKINAQVEIQSLSFTHEGETIPTLNNINLRLKRGNTLGVVGSSGSGKSTLADLVLGLRTPTSGKILIDGTDLSQLNHENWLGMVGVVDQEIFLLNDTIRNNIAFPSNDSASDMIVDAARLANAHDFIEKFPGGYDTRVGDRGIRLSGGQKQRLALARALARNPQLLILDEATSALDSESERLIQKTVATLQRSHTILVIAHRLSTVMSADEIIVLENGQIVESGAPDQLIDEGGIFAQLWRIQTETN